jgi:hypothetical protein
MSDPIYKTEKLKNPTPSALTRQAKQARSLKIIASDIGARLGQGRSIKSAGGGAQVLGKAAKKGVRLSEDFAIEKQAKSRLSTSSPLRSLEAKVKKIAGKVGKVAKKLPKGPKSLLGSFAIPTVVKAMTDRVLAHQRAAQSKAHRERGSGEGGDT